MPNFFNYIAFNYWCIIMNDSNICKNFLNQINQEATNLRVMLNQFKNGPGPTKSASYINILIWSKILYYHIQNLEKCDKKNIVSGLGNINLKYSEMKKNPKVNRA